MMDCLHDFVGEDGDERILASGEVLIAGLCRDREAWGDGYSDQVHLCQISPFTSEEISHFRFTFSETVPEGIDSFVVSHC